MANTVSAAYNTGSTTSYSAAFNPLLWSKKLNAKYYADNQLVEVVNTNWEGELKAQGDSVRIRTAPTMSVSDYVIGSNLSYQVPTPVFQDMVIDKGKSFAFQVNDVLAAQADIDLMNMFMDDASKQLKLAITDEVYFSQFIATAGTGATAATFGAATGNSGSAAGVKSGALTLGTDLVPIDTATASNLLTLILQLGAALDEQNAPEDGRVLLMTPYDRQVLMQSNLAQAYFTGDTTSIVRTGNVGTIDRFKVYVSNLLPRGTTGKSWVASSADPATGVAYTNAIARRPVIALHKDAISFANQVNKTEQVRNPNDFGDFVRGLSIYGRKVVKSEALAIGIVK